MSTELGPRFTEEFTGYKVEPVTEDTLSEQYADGHLNAYEYDLALGSLPLTSENEGDQHA